VIFFSSPGKGEGGVGVSRGHWRYMERISPPALLLAEQSDLPFSRGGESAIDLAPAIKKI
jgi:hypothetical protein